MATDISRYWNVKVYKGKYSGFNHDVIAIKLESKLIEEAKLSFLYQDLNLNFSKKIKPFMATVYNVNSQTERLLKDYANCVIGSWKEYADDAGKAKKPSNFFDLSGEDKGVDGLSSIDELLGSFIPTDEISSYYKNIKRFVSENMTLFAERGSLKKTEQGSEENSAEDSVFDKHKHLGAFLTDSYYCEQYKVANSGNSKEAGGYPLAVTIDQLKNIADINLEQYQIKDVVQAFVSRGYILRGEGSKTIEKDLTLSPKTQVRCYVLDIGKEVK